METVFRVLKHVGGAKDCILSLTESLYFYAVGTYQEVRMLTLNAQSDSLYNTMPIFSLWIAGEVIRGLIATYGDSKVAGQEAVSNAKAEAIYLIPDANPDVYQSAIEALVVLGTSLAPGSESVAM